MKVLMTESCWAPLKLRLLMGALMVGMTGSQVWYVCECATVAAIASTAAPVVFVAREIQEERKTEREIEQMDADGCGTTLAKKSAVAGRARIPATECRATLRLAQHC